ncbi:MAG: TorD/DmsD family molecular chaperone, partial [Anaerolineales bacterium]
MDINNSEPSVILMSEILLLDFLSKVFYKEPNEELISMILENNLFEEVPFAEEQESTCKALEILLEWTKDNINKSLKEILKDIKYDYTRLFIGIGKVLAPPWESVYFNIDHLVFQEQTLEVRSWYRRFNIEPEKIYKEPDDHIGLELSFVSFLTQKALDALNNSDHHEYEYYIHVKKQFLSEHVLNWAPHW